MTNIRPNGGSPKALGIKAMSENDVYWMFINNEGWGGIKVVPTFSDLLKIPSERLSVGYTIAFVKQESKFYQLEKLSKPAVSTDWATVSIGEPSEGDKSLTYKGSINEDTYLTVTLLVGKDGDFYIFTGLPNDGKSIVHPTYGVKLINNGDWLLKQEGNWVVVPLGGGSSFDPSKDQTITSTWVFDKVTNFKEGIEIVDKSGNILLKAAPVILPMLPEESEYMASAFSIGANYNTENQTHGIGIASTIAEFTLGAEQATMISLLFGDAANARIEYTYLNESGTGTSDLRINEANIVSASFLRQGNIEHNYMLFGVKGDNTTSYSIRFNAEQSVLELVGGTDGHPFGENLQMYMDSSYGSEALAATRFIGDNKVIVIDSKFTPYDTYLNAEGAIVIGHWNSHEDFADLHVLSALRATHGVYDGGVRVYSANNPPPSGGGGGSVDVVQVSGTSTTAVMSQKAVTDRFKVAEMGAGNTGASDYGAIFGAYNLVTGQSSAFGYDNSLNGTASLVVGTKNDLVGNKSSVVGYYNKSDGHYNHIFGGSNYIYDSNYFSTIFGQGNKIERSTLYNDVYGKNTIVGVSNNVKSSGYSSAFGYSNTVDGYKNTAVGYSNTATHRHASALGYFNTASNEQATAIGYNCTASGLAASAFGRQSRAIHPSSTAIGYNAVTTAADQMVLGADKFVFTGLADAQASGNRTLGVTPTGALVII